MIYSIRIIIITITFFICGTNAVCAQTLWDSLVEVKKLINENKDDDADSILDRIESQCKITDDDTIKVVFYESKGIILWSKQKYQDCIPYFLKTIELYETLNIKAQNYLDAHSAIGYSYGRLKDYDNAEKYYRKALLKSVAANYNSEFRPSVYKNLGNLYLEKGDSLLANECFKRASAANVEHLDFMNMNYLDWEKSYWDQITDFMDKKQYEEAANLYISFINGIKEKKGNKDKTYILTVYSRGILLCRYLNKIDEALPLFQELINLSTELEEPNENVCGSYCNLVLCYSLKQDYKKVDSIIPEVIAYLKKAQNEVYPPHSIYRFAGNGAYWQKDYVNAIKYYELYLQPSYTREEGTSYEEITNQLSVCYIFSNQPDKAKNILLNLLKSDESRLKKENSALLATIYHNFGRAIMLNGTKSEALKYLNKSRDMQMSIYGDVSERTLQYIKECGSK